MYVRVGRAGVLANNGRAALVRVMGGGFSVSSLPRMRMCIERSPLERQRKKKKGEREKAVSVGERENEKGERKKENLMPPIMMDSG